MVKGRPTSYFLISPTHLTNFPTPCLHPSPPQLGHVPPPMHSFSLLPSSPSQDACQLCITNECDVTATRPVLVAAGAHSTWFHLYRLVLQQPPDMHATAEQGQQQERVQQVALAVEQFLQTSTVGEYEQRLGMLWSFRFALCACHHPWVGRCCTFIIVPHALPPLPLPHWLYPHASGT